MAAALAVVAAVALTAVRTEAPLPVRASPSASPTPTATPSPAPTSPQPRVSPTGPPASPLRTLPPGAASCPTQEGGSLASQTQLVAIRVAHQSGFDRVVFELGPSSIGIGSYGMPPWLVGQAAEFRNTAGQPVPVAGNAFLQVRLAGTSTFQPDGRTPSYTGGTDLRPTTPLVRNLRLVEDFERVVIWAIGLEGLQCPRVLELADPVRLVLDLPSIP